jgi:hypothetical protein
MAAPIRNFCVTRQKRIFRGTASMFAKRRCHKFSLYDRHCEDAAKAFSVSLSCNNIQS